jgi:UPF0716 protein FxsA
MFRLLFLLFIIIPIIEITLLMQIGGMIGVWPTIAIVIFTAWLGAKNVRQQGLATMQSVQTKMAQGEMPSTEIVTGVMLLVAGVLLVTPGFVTDIFGLSLLVPQVRKALGASVQKYIHTNQGNTFGANSHFHSSGFSQTGGNVYEHEADNSNTFSEKPSAVIENEPRKGEVIEGDFERKDN